MAQKRKKKRRLSFDVGFCCLAVLGLLVFSVWKDAGAAPIGADTIETIEAFAQTHDYRLDDYPESLVALMDRNPETEDFVKQYPLKKSVKPYIDLSGLAGCREVPLLLQWDERWGYTRYGSDFMAITGCGPTALSMVAIYLTGDTSLDPRTVADFAQEHHYSVFGSGSSWTLISEGGPALGLNVQEVPLEKTVIFRYLEKGTPIIAIMGPGDFTDGGHFLVLTGVEDGKLTINDPNSTKRSEQLWVFEDIQSQFLNLWACSAGAN